MATLLEYNGHLSQRSARVFLFARVNLGSVRRPYQWESSHIQRLLSHHSSGMAPPMETDGE
jgi:hypothetical protein